MNALGKRQKAIESLRRAAKLAPNAASIFANLGEVQRQAGNKADAAKSLENAVKLDPKNAHALNNLGIIRYDEGKFEEAVDYYRRAIAVRPIRSAAAIRFATSGAWSSSHWPSVGPRSKLIRSNRLTMAVTRPAPSCSRVAVQGP